jgi:Tol biopolymer transport system component
MLSDGSGDQLFTSLNGSIDAVAFSSDGTKAAVINQIGRGDRIVLLDLANDTHSVVLAAAEAPTDVLWSVALSPRAHRVVFADGNYPRHLWSVHTDGSNLTMIAKGYGNPDWGSNGRIVASHGIFNGDGRRFIATMNPDGTDKTVIATFPPVGASWQTVYELVPSWAPDASAVVFAVQRFRIHPDVWRVQADGSGLHKLTDTAKISEARPVFSPDGSMIVFSTLQPHAAGADLWLMAPDGHNPAQLTDTSTTYEFPLAWRPV